MGPWRSVRTRLLVAVFAVAGVIGAVTFAFVATGGDRDMPPAAPRPSVVEPAPPVVAEQPDTRLPPALAVKIDMTGPARPHVGLGAADVIYVEPVESGLTRLMAMYWGERPALIGPVRSARETDIEVLAQQEGPVLAYSGSASRLVEPLEQAELVLATEGSTPHAFVRDHSRPVPHNLFVDPDELPGTEPTKSPLPTGPAPHGGQDVSDHRVTYPAATYDFTYSADDNQWLVAHNGWPLASTEHGRLAADTVVIQRVRIDRGIGITDSQGAPSPVARTVGEGDATVLRDGQLFAATWSRPSADEPTAFVTRDGNPLPMAEGVTWVLLVGR